MNQVEVLNNGNDYIEEHLDYNYQRFIHKRIQVNIFSRHQTNFL